MSRVLSSSEAQNAINQLERTINGGLLDQINALDREGTTLSDPNVWDGRLANEFRSSIWPQTKSALDAMKSELQALRERINKINLDIMTAGGNV